MSIYKLTVGEGTGVAGHQPKTREEWKVSTDMEIITIGSEEDRDITVNDVLVSRKHCVIYKENGGYFLYDGEFQRGPVVYQEKASTNGTKLQGRIIPYDTPVPFNLGEEIMVGHTTLLLSRSEED
jgi:pSer/pThr/pTyr-binding forkhead associated (FHA) protein